MQVLLPDSKNLGNLDGKIQRTIQFITYRFVYYEDTQNGSQGQQRQCHPENWSSLNFSNFSQTLGYHLRTSVRMQIVLFQSISSRFVRTPGFGGVWGSESFLYLFYSCIIPD